MAIKIRDWKFREKEIVNLYEKYGLDRATEMWIMSGVNFMVAYYFILQKYPEKNDIKEKLDKLLKWYGESIDEN